MLTTKVVSNKKPPLLSDSESGGSTSLKGNYDNDVFSASAEYGYMKNLKNDWYITPQV